MFKLIIGAGTMIFMYFLDPQSTLSAKEVVGLTPELTYLANLIVYYISYMAAFILLISGLDDVVFDRTRQKDD